MVMIVVSVYEMVSVVIVSVSFKEKVPGCGKK